MERDGVMFSQCGLIQEWPHLGHDLCRYTQLSSGTIPKWKIGVQNMGAAILAGVKQCGSLHTPPPKINVVPNIPENKKCEEKKYYNLDNEN